MTTETQSIERDKLPEMMYSLTCEKGIRRQVKTLYCVEHPVHTFKDGSRWEHRTVHIYLDDGTGLWLDLDSKTCFTHGADGGG